MTLSEIKALSDDELRVRVAELCDWWDINGLLEGRPPGGIRMVVEPMQPLPDYPRDLNAAHEMEQTLNGEAAIDEFAGEPYTLRDKYSDQLCALLDLDQYGYKWEAEFKIVTATARQRCEAFLLTLQPLPA